MHVTCHNHGHTSLSSARTFVEQNWPWTTQSGAQEYRNQFFHLHVIGARGGTSSRTWLWRDFSLAELTRQRKPTPAVFEGAWLIGAAPKVDADGRIPSGFVCRNFKEERRHSRDGVNSQLKWWKCHDQDTASACAQEEDEPQKLHNFLISSLPDTWLNSVVQRATLTSTFCMICKTDFL